MNRSVTASAGARLLDSLDPEQRIAVESRAGALFVLAGPGSGKTRTLTARIVHLLERRQVPSHQIACFVFSRAAAAEVRSRVVGAVGKSLAELLTVSTFHAFAVRVLRAASPAHLARVGWPEHKHWRVADEQEADETLRGMFDGPRIRLPEANQVGIQAVRRAATDHAAYGRWGRDAQWTLLDLWWERLAEVGLVTHDRLVPAALDAIRDDQDAARVVEQLRFVLVDEAQDLTYQEHRLATLRGEVTLVGDPRQAIFGWRGATVFHEMLADAAVGEDARTNLAHLARSYRCRGAVAQHANTVAAMLKDGARPIEPAPGASTVVHGLGRARLRAIVWEYVTTHGAGEVAVLCRTNREAETAAAELGDLAQLIRREPDEALRTGIAALRLQVNPNDNAAGRIVLKALAVTDEQILRLEEKAGAARSLWSQARADGIPGTETPMLAVDATALAALDRELGEGWERSMEYAEALDLLSDRQEADAIAQARVDGKVVVATIHASKGKEWTAVVLLTSRDWPGPRPRPEEIRTLFVASTRARAHLAIVEE